MNSIVEPAIPLAKRYVMEITYGLIKEAIKAAGLMDTGQLDPVAKARLVDHLGDYASVLGVPPEVFKVAIDTLEKDIQEEMSGEAQDE